MTLPEVLEPHIPDVVRLARGTDHEVLAMVLRRGRIELASALEHVRLALPEVTSCEVAESISRLHRRGLIRIGEQMVKRHGEIIRTAVLTLP